GPFTICARALGKGMVLDMRRRPLVLLVLLLPAIVALSSTAASAQTCHWQMVDTPNPGRYGNLFTASAATGPEDLWAVGSYLDNRAVSRAMIQHWDGSTWSLASHPDLGTESEFDAVTAIASDDAWAVGSYRVSVFEKRPLVEHWDGTAWTIVSTPVVG